VKTVALLPGIVLVSFFCACAARADEIPTYPALSCEAHCPHHVPAKPLTGINSSYLSGTPADEGFVDVSFTVDVNGLTKNPIIEQFSGTKSVVDRAIAALKRARYQPATDDGKPVAENRRFRFVFLAPPGSADSHADSSDDYQKAIGLSDAGHPEDAIAKLQSILDGSEIDFDDRVLVAGTLMQLEASAGEYGNALKHARISAIREAKQPDRNANEKAFRLLVELNAQTGQWGEAFAAYDALQKVPEIRLFAGDPDVALIARLHAKIDSQESLTAAGTIGAAGEDALWQHTLLRRTFGFSGVTGKLDKFTLRCGTLSFDSPVLDKAGWNVPSGWSGCIIYVFGSPGTTFDFVESAKRAVEAQGRHS
jgi:Gram-negative bacterial TonB protein C-terminal